MKLAVSSMGRDRTADVSSRFGRAPWFVVVDTDTNAVSAVENTQNLNALQGAGIQAAQLVATLGVGAVLTGHCGPKAFRVLSAAGVAIFVGADGTVAQAVEAWRAGALQVCERPDVEGHWT